MRTCVLDACLCASTHPTALLIITQAEVDLIVEQGRCPDLYNIQLDDGILCPSINART